MLVSRRGILSSPAAVGPPAVLAATRLSLNEDNSHYYFTRAGQKLTAEQVASWVDQYAGARIDALAQFDAHQFRQQSLGPDLARL